MKTTTVDWNHAMKTVPIFFSHLKETKFTECSHCVSQHIEDGPCAYILYKNGDPRLVKKVQLYGVLNPVFVGSETTGCLEL